jgi:Calcium-dependent channel, 7TM region, putative phosphate
MPHRARRTGSALSVAATATLCIFWSIPVAFISSLTEVNSLKKTLPGLGNFIEEHPWVEPIMALIAPLMLLLLNETVLPFILKYVKCRETFPERQWSCGRPASHSFYLFQILRSVGGAHFVCHA